MAMVAACANHQIDLLAFGLILQPQPLTQGGFGVFIGYFFLRSSFGKL
jgi:hypothetical protein